jgi:hypothetical protein
VRNHSVSFGINFENRLATGAFHVEHAFSHRTIVIEIGLNLPIDQWQAQEETTERKFWTARGF